MPGFSVEMQLKESDCQGRKVQLISLLMGTHCSEMFCSLRYPDGAGSQYHTGPVRTLDTWESTSKPDKKHLTWG